MKDCKYINNDACYPTIVTLGQIISYLKSGEVDLDTGRYIHEPDGGGCRASNYVSLLRKALKDLGMEQIPVISINMAGLESNPGFKFTPAIVQKMPDGRHVRRSFHESAVRHQTLRSEPGSANALYDRWVEKARENVISGSYRQYKRNMADIVKAFDELPLLDIKKPRSRRRGRDTGQISS